MVFLSLDFYVRNAAFVADDEFYLTLLLSRKMSSLQHPLQLYQPVLHLLLQRFNIIHLFGSHKGVQFFRQHGVAFGLGGRFQMAQDCLSHGHELS